jgi:cytochrome c
MLAVTTLACGGGDSPPADDVTEARATGAPAEPGDGTRGTMAEAEAMLGQAAEHYQNAGREAALRDITARAPGFVDRDLYVFCYGPDRTISAHAADASLVGTPVDDLRDVDGKALGTHIMEVAEANPDGGRAEYKWTNPLTGAIEGKVSVVRRVGTDVCGVGVYTPAG